MNRGAACSVNDVPSRSDNNDGVGKDKKEDRRGSIHTMRQKLQTRQYCIGNIAFSSLFLIVMSAPMNDTSQPYPAGSKSVDPKKGNTFRGIDTSRRDTNAVFNVLDALEPPPGRQLLLRGGMMILAGALFLFAIGLLVSRYTDLIRQPSAPSIQQVLAGHVMERSPAQAEPGRERNAWPDAFAAADKFDELPAIASAAGNAYVDQVVPRVPVVPVAPLVQTRKPPQEVAPRALRVTARNAATTETVPRARAREGDATSRRVRRESNRTHANRKARATEKSKRKDADVDLIAALLTRAPQKSSRAKVSDTAPPAVAGNAAGLPELHASLRGPASNTDIVIRTPADTTESLIRRCGTLGLIEGHLCRTRICSGLWEKDAACRTGNTATIH